MDTEIVIDRLTYGGDGMGRMEDGRAVFIPYVLPGEKVKIRVVEEKRGHVRGELLGVLEPSSLRIQPKCAHFGVCGGCHYQHLAYEDQLAAKQSIFREQLERIGGLHDMPVQPIVPADNPFYYRNYVQFHLTETGKPGFLAQNSNQVIEIRECHLPEVGINELWPLFDFEADSGLQSVSLRKGVDGDMLLALEGNMPQPPEFSVDFPLDAVYRSVEGEIVLSGNHYSEMKVNEKTYRVSAGSFFQVNTQQAGKMLDYLGRELPLQKTDHVLDVYCGVGLFSALLATRAAEVTGIEISEDACSDYAANLDEFDTVSLYQGNAGEILQNLKMKIDGILVDPPRAGLDRGAMEGILHLQPRWLAYISCDPSTLARDLKKLVSSGYQVKIITPFDMFPQTYHIESITILTR